MPRLAATVWKGNLDWPSRLSPRVLVHGDMFAYPVTGDALQEFWDALATIAFGSVHAYRQIRNAFRIPRKPAEPRFSNGQRAAHVVLDYFDPDPRDGRPVEQRMPLSVIRADAYDFVLSSDGLDVFIPRNPFTNDDGERDDEAGRRDVLQMYKFRKTGTPPIGLPGLPATSPEGGDDLLIPIPQLSSPTGAFQVHEDWAKGRAGDVAWWLSGTAYRGIMAELPRIIAYKWYEEVAWPEDEYNDDERTTRKRFHDENGLKELLEERTETRLPANLRIQVLSEDRMVPPEAEGLQAWNARDIMITDTTIYVPDPGKPPEASELLAAIESGQAGNPVFTDTGTGFD
jgi:hypothetical protein